MSNASKISIGKPTNGDECAEAKPNTDQDNACKYNPGGGHFCKSKSKHGNGTSTLGGQSGDRQCGSTRACGSDHGSRQSGSQGAEDSNAGKYNQGGGPFSKSKSQSKYNDGTSMLGGRIGQL
eukprot:355689-Karenia_brevis.AAC.1